MNVLYPSEAEAAILGILAGGNASDLAPIDRISAADFANPEAGCVFAACKAMRQRREQISFAGLDAELTRREGPERTGKLMQAVMRAASENALQGWQLSQHVRTISEAAQRRALAQIGEKLAQSASDATQDVAAIIDTSRTALRENVRSRGGWISATDLCLNTWNAAEKPKRPYPSGIQAIDRVMRGGLHRGEFTIIGARPAVGKSALLLHMALAAARSGARVCFVSLEMSGEQIGARILASKSGLNAGMLLCGGLPDQAWTQLADALCAMDEDHSENLFVLARGGLTLEELRSEAQSLADSGKCELLFVDYLQLLRTRQRTGSEYERLGIVSRGLKAITLDLNIPVIAAAQVKRQGSNGGAQRAPGMDELRGSGDLEQDADNVLLLHRPESSGDATLKSRSYERYIGIFEQLQEAGNKLLTVEIAKQRQGTTGRIWMAFAPAYSVFYDPLEAAS